MGIIDLFYKLKIVDKKKNFFSLAYNKILYYVFIVLYSFLYKYLKKENGINNKKRDEEVIVSLTSFPARFKYLHLCLFSIFCQKEKPDRIILWLSLLQCGYDDLPESIKEFEKYGLEIRFVEEDLKSYKKIIYSLSEYNDSVIITFDDDIIYDRDIIKDLLNSHEIYKDCVCCNMAERLVIENNKVAPYEKWTDDSPRTKTPSSIISPLTGGGTLYPPNIFDEIVINKKLIVDNAPTSDDIWMKFNEARLGIKAYHIQRDFKYPYMIGLDQKVSLYKKNVGNEGNNKAIEKLNNLFEIYWKV